MRLALNQATVILITIIDLERKQIKERVVRGLLSRAVYGSTRETRMINRVNGNSFPEEEPTGRVDKSTESIKRDSDFRRERIVWIVTPGN